MLLHLRNSLKTILLGILLYDIFLWLYAAAIRIASLFNVKARKWVAGRKNIHARIAAATAGQSPVVWMHCASLGEFEQGRPLLEEIRKQYPSCKLLLTFFSPSGYEVRQSYPGADWVFYLPPDSRRHARLFLDAVNPAVVIFVKYEFWYHYLHAVHRRRIPLLLVSAIFRKKQPFFAWYGGLHRRMLRCYSHIFVQDAASRSLLQTIVAPEKITVAGDTRFDRVAAIAANPAPLPAVEIFCKDAPVLVAGSTWPEDEQVLREALGLLPSLKLLLAPHEIDTSHLQQLREAFPDAVFYSAAQDDTEALAGARILVIDNIGMLSRLYRYAFVAYVGGGFGKGIHNVLEAAVYYKPVFFGPAFQKFREAVELAREKGAFPIQDAEQLHSQVSIFMENREAYEAACHQAGSYVNGQQGATALILHYIQEKRLLTS